MPEKPAAPSNEKIDELAQLYLDAQKATEMAREREGELREEIYHLVEKFGSVPRRAQKSKRLEGDEYQLTLSKGHSVEVNSSRVEIFWQWMKAKGHARFFRKLFKREPVFVLQPDAYARVNTIAQHNDLNALEADLVALFHQCLSVKDVAPTLKAEPRKKSEKKDEKRSEAAA